MTPVSVLEHARQVNTESHAPLSFPELLTALHAEHHTGPVTFHFINGVATAVEFPTPSTKLKLRTRA